MTTFLTPTAHTNELADWLLEVLSSDDYTARIENVSRERGSWKIEIETVFVKFSTLEIAKTGVVDVYERELADIHINRLGSHLTITFWVN